MLFYRQRDYANFLQMIIRNQSALKIQRCWRSYSLRKRMYNFNRDVILR
jgi:hypothetical protein